ncbi:MAG: hypothetical protein DDT19_01470 [Syntrophomonadaceae bacterium]|nr:hypothetical protein [Bacillota bacterium]
MAVESFLINPVKRRKKARKTNPRGLPSKLLSKMIKTHGIKEGMRKAWKSFKGGETKTNIWVGDPVGHRKAAIKGWDKRVKGATGTAYPQGAAYPRWNPFGEEVMIVGANPRRKARKRIKVNPVRKHSLLTMGKEVVRHRRRRNPVVSLGDSININKPMTLLYPVAVGVAARMATERIPRMLRITAPITRIGIQLAVGIGGGMLLNRFIGNTNAAVWAIVSGATILTDVVNRFVFRTALGYIEDNEEYLANDDEQIEAFPEESVDELSNLGAYPYDESPIY